MGVGRPSLGLVTVKVGLPSELLSQLDADGVNRSEWVREACEMRAAGLLPVRDVSEEPVAESAPARSVREHRGVVTQPARKRDWLSEGPAVLEAMGSSRYSTRDLARRLGWGEMKLARVLEAMEGAGQIRFERGVVVKA